MAFFSTMPLCSSVHLTGNCVTTNQGRITNRLPPADPTALESSTPSGSRDPFSMWLMLETSLFGLKTAEMLRRAYHRYDLYSHSSSMWAESDHSSPVLESSGSIRLELLSQRRGTAAPDCLQGTASSWRRAAVIGAPPPSHGDGRTSSACTRRSSMLALTVAALPLWCRRVDELGADRFSTDVDVVPVQRRKRRIIYAATELDRSNCSDTKRNEIN